MQENQERSAKIFNCSFINPYSSEIPRLARLTRLARLAKLSRLAGLARAFNFLKDS